MNEPLSIDGVLVRWGDRLFYPGNRRVPASTGRGGTGLRDRAAAIRQRIERTVARAPQVMAITQYLTENPNSGTVQSDRPGF
jgi:hypothetical protein